MYELSNFGDFFFLLFVNVGLLIIVVLYIEYIKCLVKICWIKLWVLMIKKLFL